MSYNKCIFSDNASAIEQIKGGGIGFKTSHGGGDDRGLGGGDTRVLVSCAKGDGTDNYLSRKLLFYMGAMTGSVVFGFLASSKMGPERAITLSTR